MLVKRYLFCNQVTVGLMVRLMPVCIGTLHFSFLVALKCGNSQRYFRAPVSSTQKRKYIRNKHLVHQEARASKAALRHLGLGTLCDFCVGKAP